MRSAMVDEEHLEGGLEDTDHLSTSAKSIVLDHCRQLIGVLLGGLDEGNAGRVLMQISKAAVSSRQLIATFDPLSGIEMEGLSGAHQNKLLRQKSSKMNRETAGVEAMKQLVGMLGVHHQAQQASQLNSLLAAAERAKDLGDDELLKTLQSRAHALAGDLVNEAGSPSSELIEVAGNLLGNMADHAEGFTVSPSGMDLLPPADLPPAYQGTISIAAPLPMAPIGYQDAASPYDSDGGL